MSISRKKLQREITAHSANSLRLFYEARRIQQDLFQLPFPERQSAMNQVRNLEREAVSEAQQSLTLEKKLAQPNS